MLFRNAVEFTQMAFGLTPEVLNPVNVVLPVCKTGAAIDAQVVKLANIQYIVGTVAISIDHTVRPYLLPDNRQQGSRLRIGYGNGVMWGGGYFCTGMTGGKKRRKTLSGADLSEAGARKNLHQLLL